MPRLALSRTMRHLMTGYAAEGSSGGGLQSEGGREAFVSDEGVLGTGRLVERRVREAEAVQDARETLRRSPVSLPVLLRRVCLDMGVTEQALVGGSRRRDVSRVRAVVACVWRERLGRSERELARAPAVHPVSIRQAGQRASAEKAQGQQKVATWCKP